MGLAQVTPTYVDLITNSQYTLRTSNPTEFNALKTMLSEAWLSSNPCYLPDRKFTHGLGLLIAHYYTYGPKDSDTSSGSGAGSTPSDTASGPVTSESVGDISFSYGDSSSHSSGGSAIDSIMAGWLGESVYGRQFMALMKTSKPTPIVT